MLEVKEDNRVYDVYAWVRMLKYYLEGESLKEDSASSIPYKFVVEKINDEFVVTDSKFPRDGSYYAEDMKTLFPKSVRNNMDDVYYDGTIERLDMEVEEQAKLYFHKYKKHRR